MYQDESKWYIGFSCEHDSSVCILENGNLLYHIIEERLTRKKNQDIPLLSLKTAISMFNSKFGGNKEIEAEISLHSLHGDLHEISSPYFTFLAHICDYAPLKSKSNLDGSRIRFNSEHHFLHALPAFLRSDFDEAICLVIDGAGKNHPYGKEHESIIYFDKRNGFNFKYLSQKVLDYKDDKNPQPFVEPTSFIGAGYAYAAISDYLGFSSLENGKTMGLSAYGKENDNVPKMISKEYVANTQFVLDRFGSSNNGPRRAFYRSTEYIESLGRDMKIREDISYRIQKDYEDYLIYLVTDKIPKLSSCKNIVITGGCALNCVANYKLLKVLPKDYNLYVEPICDDVGVSIGLSVHNSLVSGNHNVNVDGIYLGRPLTYDFSLKDNEYEIESKPSDVANLIAEGNPVAIAQGRSESGPRALGNRSLLFDPRLNNGKETLNKIKKREYFRPFAGTVMLEYAKEWFDMDRLEESPHMTYAIDVIKGKQNYIPAITHVDGTCRIQTLSKEQNKNYYDLINEFYKITKVPIVLNTSFNLAGEPMVDTIDDALWTLRNSLIEYLYLPEIGKLLYLPNDKKDNIC